MSQNNLIAKLAGTSWGASASTLHTSALALCYSVAEYCCPVWARSSSPAAQILFTPNFIALMQPRGYQYSPMLQQLDIVTVNSQPDDLSHHYS